MNENVHLNIRGILENDKLNVEQLIVELNHKISQLEIGEQADLHGELTRQQLTRLYTVLNSIVISLAAKEHITWDYFKWKCETNSSRFLSNELINEIVSSYKQNKYLGIESLIIDAMKSEKINPDTLSFLEGIFSSKAFNKELAGYRCREIVREGGRLSKEQVVKLLEYRSYMSLEYALDQNAISKEGLLEFRKPTDHENDRKAKEKLYIKAQNHPHN